MKVRIKTLEEISKNYRYDATGAAGFYSVEGKFFNMRMAEACGKIIDTNDKIDGRTWTWHDYWIDKSDQKQKLRKAIRSARWG